MNIRVWKHSLPRDSQDSLLHLLLAPLLPWDVVLSIQGHRARAAQGCRRAVHWHRKAAFLCFAQRLPGLGLWSSEALSTLSPFRTSLQPLCSQMLGSLSGPRGNRVGSGLCLAQGSITHVPQAAGLEQRFCTVAYCQVF